MDPLNANPFGLLTFIVAPAILTNASSVNVLSTSNRLARSMERARAISTQIEEHEDDPDSGNDVRLKLLKFAERRTLIIVRALTCFYIAIGSFAAASLISLLGAVFVAAQQDLLRQVTLAISLVRRRRRRRRPHLWLRPARLRNPHGTPRHGRGNKIPAQQTQAQAERI